jgi:hypothetical protein
LRFVKNPLDARLGESANCVGHRFNDRASRMVGISEFDELRVIAK